MTKQEAMNTLAGFQKAFRALDRAKAVPAVNALVNTSGVMTTDSLLAGEFSSALNILATVFDAIDRKDIQFPN